MKNQSHPRRNYYIVSLILLTFFVISFLTNIIGPLVPDIIKGFHLNLTLVAVLPFAFFIAYGIISIPAGILVEKYKEKKMMAAAFTISFVGALMLALFPNYLTAVVSLFLIGCGMAMLQVVINPLLRTSGGEEHYAFNSVLAQLIFGLASFLSPLVYSCLVTDLDTTGGTHSLLASLVPHNLPWVSLYWLFVVVSLAMIAIILVSRFPKVILSDEEKAPALQVHIALLRKPVVVLFFIGIFCYVGTEQGVANWISQFLYAYHHYDPQITGARAVAYFWGFMTAGGLLGLGLLKLMDSRKVLVGFTVMAIVSLSLGLFAKGGIVLVAFPLVGFFASVMYPVIFSLALNSLQEHHGAFSGILLTGVIGGAIVPLVIGWLGDHVGLRTGMYFLYLTLGYILSVGFWARPIIVNKTIRHGHRRDQITE
ncbi:MFS transporter [Microbacter margulisiae]|uniref:Fucose permease n=1 Tax=Microbacter margulisiae TaxID=1350067 RepID=A0A7W5H1M8_9PORP|nr:MFS transporter [Microbacter margulisiae]MBB3186546.1 fucose permease [Microbacter margulisiae]MBB3188194.1 fucose permease [Microbacter margulisiae]